MKSVTLKGNKTFTKRAHQNF